MNPNSQKSDAASDTRKRTTPRPPNFDTLKAVRNLKNAEFGDKQAVTLIETLQDAQSELATRADLEKTELALRTDMEKMESSLRHGMKRMESNLRAEMEARFSRLSWQISAHTSAAVVAITGILGLLILFK